MKKYIAALVMVLAFTGCSSTEATKTVEAPVERSSECRPVGKAMQKNLLQASDQKLKPVGRAWAIRSKDYKKVYMIASKFSVPGFTEAAVWGSNDLRLGKGFIVSVDAMADEFTDWPNVLGGNEFSIVDDGAQEALECLE